MSVGLLSFALNFLGFNRGKTQFNVSTLGQSQGYEMMNYIKMGYFWSYQSAPTDTTLPPAPLLELDANGYCTYFPAGTNGVNCNLTMETADVYAGFWVLAWDGNGTLGVSVNVQSADPGSNLTSTTGSGRYQFKRVVGDLNGLGARISINSTAASPNHVRNMRLCKIGNEAALAAGSQFDPTSLALVKSANPGVIRSLQWGGNDGAGTNDAMVALWSQRMPKSYSCYGTTYNNPAWWGGTTTNNGTDYTLSTSGTALAGFTLTNKAPVLCMFNATTPQTGSPTLSYTTVSGSPITISWPVHGLAVGNTVTFGNNGSQPPGITEAQTYYIIAPAFGANSFQVSATAGGSAVLATSSGSGSYSAVSIPRININSTGFVPITNSNTPIPGIVFLGYSGPTTGVISALVYDATVGYFYMANPNTGGTGGFNSGVPPEVFVDYCAAVGAHPHLVTPFLAIEPVSDFMTSWVTYVKNTYSWMKPRVEPPNEVWEGNHATQYAQSVGWALWPSYSFDVRNWIYYNAYGKWCSTLGQAISAIFSNDRTKYSLICGMNTGNFASINSVGAQVDVDARVLSTAYVNLNGGSPAYKWIDRVACESYFGSGDSFTPTELTEAYNYVTAANPTAAAAVLATYVANCNSGSLPSIVDKTTKHTNCKAWALSVNAANPTSTIAGLTFYEGGYGANLLSSETSNNTHSPITAATNAASCVLTLATTTNGEYGVDTGGGSVSGNPAVIGMMLDITGATGMTQLNNSSGSAAFTGGGSPTITWTPSGNAILVGQLVSFNSNNYAGGAIPVLRASPTPLVSGQPYFVVNVGSGTLQVSATKGGSPINITDTSNLSANINSGWRVTAVAGSSVTIDVNSSAFGTFTGSAQAAYDNSLNYSDVIRMAGVAAAGAMNTQMNTNIFGLAGSGWLSEYPSNYQYFGVQAAWFVMNPGIYAARNTQWNSIVAANN